MNFSSVAVSSRRKWAFALLLASGGALGLGAWQRAKIEPKPAPVSPALVQLNISPQAQQIVKGWGIYPSTSQLDRPNAGLYHIFHRPNAQRLVYGLRPTVIRANILPNSYDAGRDDGSLDTKYLDASLVRHLQMARRFGVQKYTLTVWSPPAIFKNPPTSRGQLKGAPSRLQFDREDDYCRFVVTTRSVEFTLGKSLQVTDAGRDMALQNAPSNGAPWTLAPRSIWVLTTR